MGARTIVSGWADPVPGGMYVVRIDTIGYRGRPAFYVPGGSTVELDGAHVFGVHQLADAHAIAEDTWGRVVRIASAPADDPDTHTCNACGDYYVGDDCPCEPDEYPAESTGRVGGRWYHLGPNS